MELRHCNVYSCYMLQRYDEHYPSRQFGNEGERNNFGAASTERSPGVILLTFLVVYQVATHSVLINSHGWP